MSKLSVLVADDEPLARRRLVRFLQKLDWIGRIDEAGDVEQACAKAGENPPDIVLLDIQMPGGDGFEVIERLSGAPPVVVFVTAFDHHALRAFETNAVDYITKPVEPGRFRLAMDRARAAAGARLQEDRIAELRETVASLRRALNGAAKRENEFWVKTKGEYLRIAPETIIRFQADRDYVRIHVLGESYLYHESLASLERRLDGDEFLRIHRSAIVRREAIVRIRQAAFASLIVVMSDGAEIRVGRTFAAVARACLMKSP